MKGNHVEHSTLSSVEMEQCQDRVVELERLLEESEERATRVSSHLVVREAEFDRSSLQRDALERQLANALEAQRQEAEMTTGRLKDRLEEANTLVASLRAESGIVVSQLSAAKLTVSRLESEKHDLEFQLSTTTDQSHLLRRELDASNLVIESMEAKNSKLAGLYEESKVRNASLVEEKSVLKRRVLQLKGYIAEATSQLKDNESRELVANDKIIKLQTENSSLRPKLQDAQALVTNLVRQLSGSSEQVKKIDGEPDVTRLKLKKREAEVTNLELRLEKLRQASASLENEKMYLEGRLQDMTIQLEDSSHELTKTQLDAQKWKQKLDEEIVKVRHLEFSCGQSDRLLEESEERATRVSVRLVHCEDELERLREASDSRLAAVTAELEMQLRKAATAEGPC